jgi:hypothetical protein
LEHTPILKATTVPGKRSGSVRSQHASTYSRFGVSSCMTVTPLLRRRISLVKSLNVQLRVMEAELFGSPVVILMACTTSAMRLLSGSIFLRMLRKISAGLKVLRR